MKENYKIIGQYNLRKQKKIAFIGLQLTRIQIQDVIQKAFKYVIQVIKYFLSSKFARNISSTNFPKLRGE